MPNSNLEKYAYGILTRNNSLREYEFFLSNISSELSLQELIKEFLKTRKKVRLLDLGSGEGQALKELKNLFKNQIETIGMDLLNSPKENFDRFILGNILEKEFPKECDIILGFRSLHEIGNIEKNLEKISQALKIGGLAFLSIRIQDSHNGVMQWIGKIIEQDLKFLQKIIQQKEWKNMKIQGYTVNVKLETAESITSGVNLILVRVQ
ncbi:MAG: methyltransferase domain-containing protein [Candidatus Diapherotrites archaeon]|nr:methyltransferase domain-containing protein [Candidatus Diapherotrites archaeon]